MLIAWKSKEIYLQQSAMEGKTITTTNHSEKSPQQIFTDFHTQSVTVTCVWREEAEGGSEWSILSYFSPLNIRY